MAELESDQENICEIQSLVAGTETKRMIDEGITAAGAIACSQSIGAVAEIKPVRDVIEEMVAQAAATRDRLEA